MQSLFYKIRFANSNGKTRDNFRNLNFLTGLITMAEWTESMNSVLNLDLPWRTLRAKLVEQDDDGSVEVHVNFILVLFAVGESVHNGS